MAQTFPVDPEFLFASFAWSPEMMALVRNDFPVPASPCQSDWLGKDRMCGESEKEKDRQVGVGVGACVCVLCVNE